MNETCSRLLLSIRQALECLWKRRLQYSLIFFTLLAAFWASFSIVAILSSLQRQLRADLESLGWDVINVHADPQPLRFLGHRLKISDCDQFAAIVSGICAPVNLAPTITRPDPGHELEPRGGKPPSVTTETLEQAAMLIGTTTTWNEVLPNDLVAGRFFSQGENDACVIDAWIHGRLFPDKQNWIPGQGEELWITVTVPGKDRRFRIVGIARDPFKIRERFEEWDITGAARSAVIRFMEYKNIYVPREVLTDNQSILGAVIKVGPGVDPIAGAERIREYLEDKNSTALAWSRKRWSQNILDAAAVLATISNFLWFVVLIVTSFMVMTVILIVVRGRYREIAIRRVEGARRYQIATQLIAESVLLGLAAALLGMGVAQISGLWLETRFLGWPVSLTIEDIAIVGLAGLLIIAVTTLIPARRAAAIDPVDILRRLT